MRGGKIFKKMGARAVREGLKRVFFHGIEKNKDKSVSRDFFQADPNTPKGEYKTEREEIRDEVRDDMKLEEDIVSELGEAFGKADRRPTENGLMIQRQSRPRRVSDMTKKERAEIAARAADGALIKFN